MQKKVFIIGGMNFSTLERFFSEIQSAFGLDSHQGTNLNAFNDILRGGFGDLGEEGFILRWENSEVSRSRLGDKLGEDEEGRGQTAFDTLLEIISVHCKAGEEEADGVELQLL